jgi:hypothetical protein
MNSVITYETQQEQYNNWIYKCKYVFKDDWTAEQMEQN